MQRANVAGLVLVFLVGCAEKPILELQEVEQAIAQARDAEADIYAPEAYDFALTNLESGFTAIEDQEAEPPWRRDYEPALDLLGLAFEQAGEAAALAALAEVEQFLKVDTGRRVVMGYSLGGMGTWHFAAKFRHRFVAAIPVAGAPRQADLERLRDLPLYVIHSRNDRIVPITGDAEAVARLQAMGAPVQFTALPTGDHFDYDLVIAELRKAAAWLEEVWQRP